MISIIIPLYNKQDSIQSTLDSVLQQKFQDYEIIVIDDGSTDRSTEKVLELKDERINLIHKSNGGVCSARNKGIEFSKYAYIAFLDADDIWEPEYLIEQCKLINNFSDAALWSCAYGHMQGEKRENVDHVLPIGFRDYVKDYFRMRRKTDLFCSSSVVIKKQAFEVAGLFDTRIKFSEDLDMWYRIIIQFPVVFFNKTYVYYRQDAENRALQRKIILKEFLPYYIDKYNSDKNIKDYSFLNFINNWSAIKLQHYYFDKKEERVDATLAIKKLNYHLIKKKYFLMYKTPFWFGCIVYKLMLLKKSLW